MYILYVGKECNKNLKDSIIKLLQLSADKIIKDYKASLTDWKQEYPDIEDILKESIRSLKWIDYKEYSRLTIDSTKLHNGISLDSICRRINSGDLTKRGTHIFHNMFNWLKENENLLKAVL